MKLAVSYDAGGQILTLFDPAKMHGDKGSLSYVPAKGEKHQVIEVPKEFEGRPVMELAKSLRVNASGAHPKLEPKG
jgi:hypothetical protein